MGTTGIPGAPNVTLSLISSTVSDANVSVSSTTGLRDASGALDIFIVIIWSIVTISGITGNILLLLAVAASRTLHTKTNVLVINVVIADILVCCLLPFQAAVLLSSQSNVGLPDFITSCTGVAAIFAVCTWSRIITFGVMSHQRLFQHLNSKLCCADFYKPIVLIAFLFTIWISITVAIVTLLIFTECLKLGKLSTVHLCVLQFNDEVISGAVVVGVWFLTVLFATINYWKIYRLEKKRRLQKKSSPRKKRRPHPRKDAKAFQTPESPFEEVQEATTHLNSQKKKKRRGFNISGSSKKEHLGKDLQTKDRGLPDDATKQNPSGLGSTWKKATNRLGTGTLEREFMMMFVKKRGDESSESGTAFPKARWKKSVTAECGVEVTTGKDSTDSRSAGNSLFKIHRRDKTNVGSDVKHTDDSSHYINYDVGKPVQDNTEIKSDMMTTENARNRGSFLFKMKRNNGTNCGDVINHTHGSGYCINYCSEEDEDSEEESDLKEECRHDVDEFALPANIDDHGNRQTRHDENLRAEKTRCADDHKRVSRRSLIAATRSLAIVSFMYFILVVPNLLCSQISGCPPLLYKFAHTVFVASSCLHPTMLAFKHPTITTVVGHVFHRRWKFIPAPTLWVSRLLIKDDNDAGV